MHIIIIMASLTIDLSESQLQKLQDLARSHGVTPEALLRANLENWLNRQKSEFTNAADYVLQKNTKLYQRLA